MFMRKISSKMCEHISNLYTVKQYNDGNPECKYDSIVPAALFFSGDIIKYVLWFFATVIL